jgi:riboflavin biosynthesis pyrimidine reductase
MAARLAVDPHTMHVALEAAVRELKARPGRELQVHGSGVLLRWLLERDLVDELNLELHPVVVVPHSAGPVVGFCTRIGVGRDTRFERITRRMQNRITVTVRQLHIIKQAFPNSLKAQRRVCSHGAT